MKRKIMLILGTIIFGGALLISYGLWWQSEHGKTKYLVNFMVDDIVYKRIQTNDDGYIDELPDAPIKEDATFLYWTLDGIRFDVSEKITKNLEVIAYYQNNKKTTFKVIFDKDNGEALVEKIVYLDECVDKIDDPKKEGYTFEGWYAGYEDKEVDRYDYQTYDFKETVTSDLVLKAKWRKAAYIVEFNSDGGSSISKKIVEHNNKLEEPTSPKKEGYTFNGWYLNGEKYDFNEKVTKDITLTASWKKSIYDVSFNSDGGNNIQKQNVEYLQKAKEPIAPMKLGYKFSGWYLNATKYDFNSSVTSNIILTAKWEKITKIAYGDVNEDGEINLIDSIQLTRIYQKYKNLEITEQGLANADVNCDGVVNMVDGALLLEYISGGEFHVSLPSEPILNFVLYGDVTNDGFLKQDDYDMLASFLKNNAKLDKQSLKNADANGDGVINETDLQVLKNKIAQHDENGCSAQSKPLE